jgi:hypothetical protein
MGKKQYQKTTQQLKQQQRNKYIPRIIGFYLMDNPAFCTKRTKKFLSLKRKYFENICS